MVKTEEEKIYLLKEWEKSGLTASNFCKNNDLTPSTFSGWKKRLISQEKMDSKFTKIPTPTQVQFTSNTRLKTVINCKNIQIELTGEESLEYLQTIFLALRSL